MSTTTIQWTDRTWNPVRGCSVVSPGCVNCYAMKQAHRFSGKGRAYEGLTKQTTAGHLIDPLVWHRLVEQVGPLRGRKGGDMAEWPADLRVREFPQVMA